jgi:hypothetical protein
VPKVADQGPDQVPIAWRENPFLVWAPELQDRRIFKVRFCQCPQKNSRGGMGKVQTWVSANDGRPHVSQETPWKKTGTAKRACAPGQMWSPKQTGQPVPEMAHPWSKQMPEPRGEVIAWCGLAIIQEWQVLEIVTKRSYGKNTAVLWHREGWDEMKKPQSKDQLCEECEAEDAKNLEKILQAMLEAEKAERKKNCPQCRQPKPTKPKQPRKA